MHKKNVLITAFKLHLNCIKSLKMGFVKKKEEV